MPRSIWSGSISFGLVNIPVKLVVAVRDKSVRFHKLHAGDGMRLQQKMVCPADGEEVSDEDTVRGYELDSGEYVVVGQEELDALAPKAGRTIEITDFVDLAEVDPVYYERPYYLVPDEQSARPYALLIEAMLDTGRVGVAKFVMHNKEYLAVLRPVDGVICMETMRFGDEVVRPADLEIPGPEAKAEPRQLEIARQLIDALYTKFEPARYHDDYREAVAGLIERKAEGREVVAPAAEVEEPGKVIDLMAALEASLSRARQEGGKGKSRAGRKARKPAAKKAGSVNGSKRSASNASSRKQRRAG